MHLLYIKLSTFCKRHNKSTEKIFKMHRFLLIWHHDLSHIGIWSLLFKLIYFYQLLWIPTLINMPLYFDDRFELLKFHLKTNLIIEISLFNRLMMELYCHPLSGKCAQSWSSILGGNRKIRLLNTRNMKRRRKTRLLNQLHSLIIWFLHQNTFTFSNRFPFAAAADFSSHCVSFNNLIWNISIRISTF